jgi:glutamate-1-semialdehyde 2,1-aminomutase
MYGHQSVGLLPDDYPQFFERGEGAHIWDVDGTRYLDFMCAYGPNLFGYAHPRSTRPTCASWAWATP